MPFFSRSSVGRFPRAPVLVVCAGFSVFVLVLCVLAGLHFEQTLEQSYYRDTGNIAQVLMASFDDDASTADAILNRLAANIPESEVSAAHETELHALLSGYALQPWMIGPAVLDRNGTLIASGRVNPIPNISLGNSNTFRVHADTSGASRLYISTPVRGVLTNEWSIQFSRPLRDRTGAFYGVVLLSYRLQHFVSLYEKLKLSDRGLAGLTGNDGVVRIRTLNGEIGYGYAMPRFPLVFARVQAGETSGTFFGRNGVDDVTRIGSFVVSDKTPFFVTVGYDSGDLRAQYRGIVYALGLCWLVLTAAMIGTAAFIHRLGAVDQQRKLDIVASALAERQKIAADMHDSIGASLAALLAYFTTETINIVDVKRRLGEILMELRFLVDSTETEGGDIDLLLSNVRHRMGAAIELAGIALVWQVGALPRIAALTARDALTIKLVLMEALGNVLHHSKAGTVTVEASSDVQAIRIAVSDDGIGFDPGAAASGRGLRNMRKRIASLSIGGAIAIDSSPGHGTTVRIELQRPSDS